MRVAIDISSLPYQRGVSLYTANLVRALDRHPDVELSLFGYSLRQSEALTQAASVVSPTASKHILSLPPSVVAHWWNTAGSVLAPGLILPRSEIFHAWEEAVPTLRDRPVVVTIHDLAMLKFPHTAHPSTLAKHRAGWKKIHENNLHVIAVSTATKKDIIEFLQIDPEHIHVIPEALPVEMTRTLSADEAMAILESLAISRPYLLFVGTNEPRKNLERLVEAWQELATDVDLVIAGDLGWGSDFTKYSHQPIRLGRVTAEQLAALYQEAAVFVYPSLYEGFGLPILEAFHFGTPVVTSNTSSMPEVAGNAAELVDPLDPTDIARGIRTVVSENEQAQRNRQQQMKIRGKLFSWTHVATKTVAVYSQAIHDYEHR